MRHLNINFLYSGRKMGITHDDEVANKALVTAEKKVTEILGNLKIPCVHAYAWPDGSLYEYIKTDLTDEQLRQAFDSEDLRVDGISDIAPETKLRNWEDDSPRIIDILDKQVV